MFKPKDESTLEQLTQLQLIVSLIAEKYNIDADMVDGRIANSPDKVCVVLLNGLSGVDTPDVDECNRRPIEFLKAYDGEVTKEEHEHHSYYSYSVITLNKEKLDQIVKGLHVLPSPDNNPEPRMMLRC